MSRSATVPSVAAAPATGLPRRLAAVVVGHTAVDVYAAFVPPLLGVLEVRCGLTAAQAAWLLGIGSLSSGLSQPLAAWLSDRTDSRIFAAVGLAVAAVCLSSIGYATSFATLLPLYIAGMIGVGIYHPIGASSAGQLADARPTGRRSLVLGIFFVAGMAGGITGAMLATRTATWPGGLEVLRWAAVPGLALAALVHLAIRDVPHRHHEHHAIRFDRSDIRQRWLTVGLLYVGNAMRFIVNIGLLYLFVRWAQAPWARRHPEWTDRAVAEAAAPLIGNMNALAILGMAVGGLVAGAVVRPGREKTALVIVPACCAPCIALIPWAGPAGGCALAVAAGIGWAATVPLTMSLSQRLLPHRTSLASGLMLGGAWSLAMLGPVLAEWCLHTLGLGLGRTFALAAVLLAASGLVALPIRRDLLARTARPS
ncbi:MAG: MFS transporter [Planctomycetota bacterium]|jgi:MFS family permease